MSSRRFSYKGFVSGLLMGAVLGGLVASVHWSRELTAALQTQKSTLQDEFLKTTAGVQQQMEVCAKDRQAHLADRLMLLDNLSACQKKLASSIQAPIAPVLPAPAVASSEPPASSVQTSFAQAAPLLPQKQVKVLRPRPRPELKGKATQQTIEPEAPAPLAESQPQSSTAHPPTQNAPTALSSSGPPSGPALGKGQSVTLSVGQEQRVGASGVLSLEAVSRLQTGKFCVISGPNDEAIRIASGTGKIVMLGGVRYTLVATVRDGQSCKFSIQ